jgi:thioredoxin-like negative regulator of GroEL
MSLATSVQDCKFDALLTDEGLVVIDCTTVWCDPYRTSSPLISYLAQEHKGRSRAVKLEIDRNYSLAQTLNSRMKPAILVFKSGKLLENLPSYTSYEQVRDAIARHNNIQPGFQIQTRRAWLNTLRYEVS